MLFFHSWWRTSLPGTGIVRDMAQLQFIVYNRVQYLFLYNLKTITADKVITRKDKSSKKDDFCYQNENSILFFN